MVLLQGERARQTAFSSGNVIRDEQMGQGRELLGPGEFFQHTAQIDHIPGATDGTPRRVARSEEGQPAEEMWVAPQLVKRANLRMLSAKKHEEVADGCAVASDG
ncbi:MAG: hypothetical protein ABSD20_16860 [Terriglobales bacterium]